MSRPFLKMNGLGNDFVVVEARSAPFEPSPAAKPLAASCCAASAVLRSVSHDLRSPLMAILTSAGALARRDFDLDQTDRRELVDARVESVGNVTTVRDAGIAVAVLVEAVLAVEPDALEIIIHDEVDDTGHGVGPVDRGGAAGEDFNALDQSRRDQVEIGRLACAVGIARRQTTAVDQRQAGPLVLDLLGAREQAGLLMHCSNLYGSPQGEHLVETLSRTVPHAVAGEATLDPAVLAAMTDYCVGALS